MTHRKVIRERLRRQAQILLSRDCFWDFCKALAPDFYLDDRSHLKLLCFTLQYLYQKKLRRPGGGFYRKLIVEIPPQHGKTRTLVLFCMWVFGQDPGEKVLTASYNDLTAIDFAKYTRDGIAQEKFDPDDLVYNDVFPGTRIKRTDSPKQRWALAGQHFSYIAAGVGGSLTSKGGTILIIDDPVKGAIEALNADHLEKIWHWYTNTFKTRISAKGGLAIEIVVATPWARKDVSGRLLAGRQKRDWYRLSLPVIDIPYEKVVEELDLPESAKTGRMLCADLFSRKALDDKISLDETIEAIDKANYFMLRVDVEGRLYKGFKTYGKLPAGRGGRLLYERIQSYTDTADEGDDYLCSIVYLVYQGHAYVLDVYYTDAAMEITEFEVARRQKEYGVGMALIESNSGGRGFARAVRQKLKQMAAYSVAVRWFHQTQNKTGRIISNSSAVQNRILFPVDWQYRWPLFYSHVTEFQQKGKKQPDDGPDVLTGIVENMSNKISWGS